METEEVKRARLVNDTTKLLSLAIETDEERKQDWRSGSYHTAQVGPGDRGRKKSKKKDWI